MVDRRAKLNVEIPYLLKKIMGVDFLLFRQRNTKGSKHQHASIQTKLHTNKNLYIYTYTSGWICIYSWTVLNGEYLLFLNHCKRKKKGFLMISGHLLFIYTIYMNSSTRFKSWRYTSLVLGLKCCFHPTSLILMSIF